MGILIVDDDAAIRAMVSDLLTDEGYAVASAADGQEALAYLDQQDAMPCVIVLDLMMPRMNGWEFRAAQQQHPIFATIPVVVLSARLDSVDSAIDVAERLAKPINVDRLLSAVHRHCARAAG
ncbi:MAG: response regulator [Chloroflexales bacterium]|nr:response regulator [Chloroflexales bacterium]